MTEPTILGIDLGGTKIAVGTVRSGRITRLEQRPVPAMAPAQVVLDHVIDTIAGVFDESVVGMGFGVPSVIDLADGVVRDVGNIPSWKEVHLKAVLEERFGVTVQVNNDANAFTVGEYVFGSARNYRNVVGMTLGTGLGTGLVMNGRLYSGANCGAGEIGMMSYRGGLLEDWCAGPFFRRETGKEGDVLHRQARDGDTAAIAAFHRYGRELSEAVKIALLAYDPDIVVMGGSIASAFDLFEAGLREGLADFVYPHSIERLTITTSHLQHAAVLGAAALWVDAMGSSAPDQ